ncbi:MAG TPA: flagellar biosynthetic protein FliO [Rhodocyclaceae bacterium]|nr:flagellar biosynthetic protein FliO [Rhodocyclaceae bacterium]
MKRIASLSLLVPASTFAATGMPSATASMAQMLLGLGVVLVVMFGALHLLRKLQTSRQGISGAIKVISAAAVGPRERVVLVAIGQKVLVLGVAPGRVSALHSMDATDLPAAPNTGNTAPTAFAERLRQLIDGKRHAN